MKAANAAQAPAPSTRTTGREPLAPCVAVIGPANSGKTTILHLFDEALQLHPETPLVYVVKGNPDGTGRYLFRAPQLREPLKPRVKGSWTRLEASFRADAAMPEDTLNRAVVERLTEELLSLRVRRDHPTYLDLRLPRAWTLADLADLAGLTAPDRFLPVGFVRHLPALPRPEGPPPPGRSVRETIGPRSSRRCRSI